MKEWTGSRFRVAAHEELEQEDREYWANASYNEKSETITYLRECFYGSEATTGRLQRFYQILELKWSKIEQFQDVESVDAYSGTESKFIFKLCQENLD